MTRAQRGRPVGASGEETRRRIVAATMRCVATVGYARATIREIARTANVTSASLYNYFPNKSELMKAAVAARTDIAVPRLRRSAARPGDAITRLEAVLAESGRLMRDYPDLAAFERAMRVIGHEPGDRLRQSGPKALRAIIAEVIEDARTQGELPAGTEPRAAVNAIHALARGLTERAASLGPDAYAATLDSAKGLLRGTLFTDGRQ
ncbi:TetR/AcrR family transcriptional regulator [Mycobacterium colombiense]|uniref:TetR/AcrR family transcriptional regulator n=3 Tax=Mycobacterium colombiense TaxID=339268 RepID=UPI0007ECD0FB|nr:TetR/AcrR family transcriptional regulator [Mycobacterium colombiense]OBJ21880.1 TetR family transcriptional regulator [Mycobacterium colombiense]